MTKEEAITLIKSTLKTMYLPKSKEYISDLGYALEIAIKALEQTSWIPVTERLPKRSGEFFVSVIDGSGEDNDYESVGMAWFAHKKDYDIKESEWRELGIDETVIAWMPLPKVYEPQERSDRK